MSDEYSFHHRSLPISTSRIRKITLTVLKTSPKRNIKLRFLETGTHSRVRYLRSFFEHLYLMTLYKEAMSVNRSRFLSGGLDLLRLIGAITILRLFYGVRYLQMVEFIYTENTCLDKRPHHSGPRISQFSQEASN